MLNSHHRNANAKECFHSYASDNSDHARIMLVWNPATVSLTVDAVNPYGSEADCTGKKWAFVFPVSASDFIPITWSDANPSMNFLVFSMDSFFLQHPLQILFPYQGLKIRQFGSAAPCLDFNSIISGSVLLENNYTWCNDILDEARIL